MRILNLSAVDYGGAGQMALSYHDLFRELKHDSYLIVKDSKSSLSLPVYKRRFPEKLSKFFFNRAYRGLKLHEAYHFYNRLENYRTASAHEILRRCPFTPEIIVLYWVSEFINASVISELYRLTGARIYWMMIDNAPITGGCHYPWECAGYKTTCSLCPAIINRKYAKLASANLRAKLSYLPLEVVLIAYSSIDYERARLSALFQGKTVLRQLVYVDETTFLPALDREAAKKYWGISSNKKVIFFGAADINDSRKGFKILVDTVNQLSDQEIVLLIAGNADAGLFKKDALVLGFLNEGRLVKAYQAADVFVCPSVEDSGPIMINQSIMCGTPVVAFRTGVAPDLIAEGETGFLANHKTANELSHSLELFLKLDAEAQDTMRKNCRSNGIKLFGKSATIQWLEAMFHPNYQRLKYRGF